MSKSVLPIASHPAICIFYQDKTEIGEKYNG